MVMKEKNYRAIKNIINKLICMGIIMLPTIYFGIYGKTVEMGLAIVASSITCSFINLDKIAKFKGAGFEAEMREAVNEAYTTIDMLKKTSIPLVITSLHAITWGDRYGSGLKSETKHKLKDQITEVIETLRIKSEDADQLLLDFTRLTTCDLWNDFIKSFNKDTLGKNNSELSKLCDCSIGKFPKKEEIDKFFGGNQLILTPENEEKLQNYLYYLKHNELKNI